LSLSHLRSEAAPGSRPPRVAARSGTRPVARARSQELLLPRRLCRSGGPRLDVEPRTELRREFRATLHRLRRRFAFELPRAQTRSSLLELIDERVELSLLRRDAIRKLAGEILRIPVEDGVERSPREVALIEGHHGGPSLVGTAHLCPRDVLA